MDHQITDEIAQFNSLFSDKRAWLVGLCTRLSGDPDAAEDLAQETLIIAWKRRQRLYDQRRLAAWLAGIARNVSRDWLRRRRRELARCVPLDGDDEHVLRSTSDTNVEITLERHELAVLLDRALALLPAETRQVLAQRYVEEHQYAAIAARMGISQGAVAVRLHRGRIALRQVLLRELRSEAAAYGLVAPAAERWQPTPIWCPWCGQQRLSGCFDPAIGFLAFRCPQCCREPNAYVAYSDQPPPGGFGRAHGHWAALARMMTWMDVYYRCALRHGHAACPDCGQLALVQLAVPADAPAEFRALPGMQVCCPACRATSWTSLRNLARNLPEVRAFWQQHKRICTLPEREVKLNGRAALVTRFESMTGSATLDVMFARDTYAILLIDGAACAA